MNANSIGYYLMPNPTGTAVQAPYLPKLVPNGVANLNDIAKKVAESLPVSEERAKLLIRENFTESLKMALAGYTVDMGALRMKARIPGSMPCEDAPFDPETNACVIELYADGELSGAFDELVPVKLTAEQLRNAIKFSNVMDVGTQNMGEIHGTDEFMILGNGITLDAEGESAKLLDKRTGAVLATAEIETVSKGQRATCAFAAVPGGIAKGYGIKLTGTGLDTVEHLLWDDSLDHGGEIDLEHCTSNEDSTELTVDAEAIAEIVPDSVPEGLMFGFTAKSHGGVPSSPEQTSRHSGIVIYD